MKKIFIAYSGGLDSHVLLHLFSQIRKLDTKLELIAIHVNHNLSSNAKEWAKHCRKICKDLKIKCIIKNVDAKIKIKSRSPEEIARKLRYAVFANVLTKNSILITAHQANDQAETLLLQLFRGAGPKGLSAMPAAIKFAKGWLMRPLLRFSREELLEYAKSYDLNWIEDESNTDIRFGRNFVRHELMPIIKKNWPGIITTLNRAASHCAEASELLDSLAAEDLKYATTEQEVMPQCVKCMKYINIVHLKKLSTARQYNILRYWLRTLNLPTPSEKKLHEVVRTIINSRSDAVPIVKWSGVEIRRFQNNLYAMAPLLPHDNKTMLEVLRIKNKVFTIKFRRGGEKLKIPNRQGTHQLKKLMQEWQIPPWLRDRVPLLYCDEELIAVITE